MQALKMAVALGLAVILLLAALGAVALAGLPGNTSLIYARLSDGIEDGRPDIAANITGERLVIAWTRGRDPDAGLFGYVYLALALVSDAKWQAPLRVRYQRPACRLHGLPLQQRLKMPVQ